MNAKPICILVVAMFLIGNSAYAGSWNKDKNSAGINAFDKRAKKLSFFEIIIQMLFFKFLLPLNMQVIKPEPLDEGDVVKIYNGFVYAQAFYPYFENVTKIELPISIVKKSLNSRSAGSIKRIATGKESSKSGFVRVTSAHPISYNELGDLVVMLCNDSNGLPGDVIAEKRFSPEEVKASNGNLIWDMKDGYALIRAADDPYWQKHNMQPRNEEYGSKVYYIIVTADGGSDTWLKRAYYTWEKGGSMTENATNGSAFMKYPESNTWTEIGDFTLAFNMQGALGYEKPDGVVKYYGLFLTQPAYKQWTKKFASRFLGEHIIYAPPREYKYELDEIYGTLESIDAESDGDDVIIFYICGPGGPLDVFGVTADELVKRFDRMGAGGMCMIFSGCWSGTFVAYPPLRKENRVIMSSVGWQEVSTPQKYDPMPFVYFFNEALKKGYTTAESCFAYAKEKTEEVSKDFPYGPQHHPQIYDSYPAENPDGGELTIAR
ncbi:MAG: hypothetical protein J7J36_05485 [Thermoplasmata archaeon]|nr:hypothetical protein [Thermoplasmata archaeon]